MWKNFVLCDVMIGDLSTIEMYFEKFDSILDNDISLGKIPAGDEYPYIKNLWFQFLHDNNLTMTQSNCEPFKDTKKRVRD